MQASANTAVFGTRKLIFTRKILKKFRAINDLIFDFDENENCILFADDTTIHASGSNMKSCVDSFKSRNREIVYVVYIQPLTSQLGQDIYDACVKNVSSSNTISVRRTYWAKRQLPWSINSNYWAYCWITR